jgi:Ca2+-transporting ATPase
MGRRGTQVAREAAAMVLQDDELHTVAVAALQGRVIFGNIRKFVVYLLSCNVSEVLTVALAALAPVPLPLLPLQILFLNLVTDVFPALALGFGEGNRGSMNHPPRAAHEPILRGTDWRTIATHGALLTAAVLGAFATALALGMPDEQAVTVSFLTLATVQLWHVFDVRDPGTSLVASDVARNPWVWGALVLCLALLAAAFHVPVLAEVLDLHAIGARGAWLVVGFGVAPVAVVQVGFVWGAVRRG